jgi:hypothetical protein
MTVDLITEDTEWPWGEKHTQYGYHERWDVLCPRMDEAGWHKISSCIQDGTQFKIHKLFISRIFHFGKWLTTGN